MTITLYVAITIWAYIITLITSAAEDML